jgi:hypothetical protein
MVSESFALLFVRMNAHSRPRLRLRRYPPSSVLLVYPNQSARDQKDHGGCEGLTR